jgi:hypothetical protein
MANAALNAPAASSVFKNESTFKKSIFLFDATFTLVPIFGIQMPAE